MAAPPRGSSILLLRTGIRPSLSAPLVGADLRGADLGGFSLLAALDAGLLKGADLTRALYDTPNRWPPFFNPDPRGCRRR